MTTTRTKARKTTRGRKRKETDPALKEAMEFLENVQRLERERIPILPEHPPLH